MQHLILSLRQALKSFHQNMRMTNLLKNPELIVGKTIYHTSVVDEETKEQQTFKGKVISQVRVGRNKSYFNVTYDDFRDKYWTYQILQDYFEGDLRFEYVM